MSSFPCVGAVCVCLGFGGVGLFDVGFLLFVCMRGWVFLSFFLLMSRNKFLGATFRDNTRAGAF